MNRACAALLTAVATMAAACCSPAPSQALAAEKWVDVATVARQPPAGTGPGAALSWTGADGKPVAVAVAAPRPASRSIVVVLHPARGDNRAAIQAGLAKLRAAGGGTLRLMPGVYPVAGAAPFVTIDGLSDVLIDGTGARLVFAAWGDGILIRNSARIALRGLAVGYAHPALVAATVRSGAAGPELAFDTPADIPVDATAHQVSRFASGGVSGLRILLGKQGNKLLPGAAPGRFTLAGAALRGLSDGDAVQVKLTYYKGAAIHIMDNGDQPVSHDIMLDRVTVGGSAGGGVVADLMGRGLAVLNSQFGSSTGPAGATIAYDAFHVTAMTGDLLLQGNRFTGSGDDAMNLSSPIFDITDYNGQSAKIGTKTGGVYPGARLALFDADLRLIGTTRVAARAARDARGLIAVTFVNPVAASTVRYARNLDLLGTRYAIVGNAVNQCRCHGLLAQGPNGLIRGNQFGALSVNAIRLLTSVNWKEGSGAQNVVVERNRINDTGPDERRGVVWAAISVYGELAPAEGLSGQAPVAAEPVNARLLIRDNVIANVDQGCISIASAADVLLGANTCSHFNRNPAVARLLVERADVGDALRRLPAKSAYLARGDGIWIDPLSTARVRAAGGAR